MYRVKETDAKTGKRLSAMIAGADEIVNIQYSDLESLQKILASFFRDWSRDRVEIEFNLQNPNFSEEEHWFRGKAAYVVGNTPELGSWDPARAVKMTRDPQNGQRFQLRLRSKLSSLSSPMEYKYIVQPSCLSPDVFDKSQLSWETCFNREIRAPEKPRRKIAVFDTWCQNFSSKPSNQKAQKK